MSIPSSPYPAAYAALNRRPAKSQSEVKFGHGGPSRCSFDKNITLPNGTQTISHGEHACRPFNPVKDVMPWILGFGIPFAFVALVAIFASRSKKSQPVNEELGNIASHQGITPLEPTNLNNPNAAKPENARRMSADTIA